MKNFPNSTLSKLIMIGELLQNIATNLTLSNPILFYKTSRFCLWWLILLLSVLGSFGTHALCKSSSILTWKPPMARPMLLKWQGKLTAMLTKGFRAGRQILFVQNEFGGIGKSKLSDFWEETGMGIRIPWDSTNSEKHASEHLVKQWNLLPEHRQKNLEVFFFCDLPRALTAEGVISWPVLKGLIENIQGGKLLVNHYHTVVESNIIKLVQKWFC